MVKAARTGRAVGGGGRSPQNHGVACRQSPLWSSLDNAVWASLSVHRKGIPSQAAMPGAQVPCPPCPHTLEVGPTIVIAFTCLPGSGSHLGECWGWGPGSAPEGVSWAQGHSAVQPEVLRMLAGARLPWGGGKEGERDVGAWLWSQDEGVATRTQVLEV